MRIMRAKRLPDGTLSVSGASNNILFTRICAGIAWPEHDPGHLCVVGERSLDGLYHCLWERPGGLWELGDAAREARANFLVDCFWVDARDVLSTSYMRNLEGLCTSPILVHRGTTQDRSAQTAIVVSPGRDHDLNNPAAVAPVQERILQNYRSALEKTRAAIMTGRVLIHETNCARVAYALRQPLETLLHSPVMKSLVWVVTALELTGENWGDIPENDWSWYGNPKRDPRPQ